MKRPVELNSMSCYMFKYGVITRTRDLRQWRRRLEPIEWIHLVFITVLLLTAEFEKFVQAVMSDSAETSGVAGATGAAMYIDGVPKFDLSGDPNELNDTWVKWKRGFDFYLRSRAIKDEDQKKALLFHCGGMALQELYFTLDSEEKDYKATLEILNQYFLPKKNIPYERHLFRKMKQSDGETVDQFAYRLRKKAAHCGFQDVDEMIRDQLIDSCHNQAIRRKFLESAATCTLDKLLESARSMEAVECQMKEMKMGPDRAEMVNAVDRKGKSRRYGKPGAKSEGKKKCFRCGETGHFAKDPKCPARSEKCTKCGLMGHRAICCRTKKPSKGKQGKSDRAYKVDEKESTEFVFSVDSDKCDTCALKDSDDCAFKIGENENGDIDIDVSGVKINVLIDSGATCNIVDEHTWAKLKQARIQCSNRKDEREIYAYGQSKPLKTLGTFTSMVRCDDTQTVSEESFVVIKGEGKSLLGRRTAERLGVLRIGPSESINLVSENEDITGKFENVFKGVGKLKGQKVKLHIDPKVRPVAQPLRKIPYGLRDKVDEQIGDLLEKDIIEKVEDSPSQWVSPLVVVPKSSGEYRICVDMRRANEAIVRERHPIPTIEDVLNEMNGAKMFSKLDLKWGFHQVELDEESRDITTFRTHAGIFRYKRLMFGISSAPEKYQNVIHNVIAGCKGAANMADDIIVYGVDKQEHDENLFAVLARIAESGLTLNPKKCEFRLTKLTFFGHDLSAEGISASNEKVAAIKEASEPETVAEVRSFLGLVQYSAKFIANYAQIAEPLRKLTRKNVKFEWGIEQKQAFAKLKEEITHSGTLAYFRQDCKTRIVADAGPAGLGAVLLQQQDEFWRPIAYASRCLSDVERRYSQTEKEALALVWACERFNLYVYGRKFELETDHKPLEVIYGRKSKPSARIERWVLRLQGYEYNVVYRPGKSNIADCLSRLNRGSNTDDSGEKEDVVRFVARDSEPVAMSIREIEIESAKDEELSSVRQYIQMGNWKDCKMLSYSAIKNELCSVGQVIMRGSRIVIPKSLRREVLKLAHEGHQGITKTKLRLRQKVWWPKIDHDAEKLCRSCRGCQVVGPYSPPEPMQRVEPPTGPWQDLAIDLLGPLPNGENILVVVDYYSRYYEIAIMRSTTARKVVEALAPMIARHGVPFSIKSDNGPQFVSGEFSEFLRTYGIEHRRSPPLWPQANGEVEAQNRSLVKTLKIAQIEGKDMREELTKFLMAYRSTPQITTGQSPAKLLFGRELKTKLPELRCDRSILNEEVRDKDWEKKLGEKQYADARRGAKPSSLKSGDEVLIRNETKHNKLAPNFEPESVVVKRKEGNEVVVETQEGVEKRRNSTFVKPVCQETVNVDRPRRERKLPGKLDDFVVDIK
jgi:transposase InsO family protein